MKGSEIERNQFDQPGEAFDQSGIEATRSRLRQARSMTQQAINLETFSSPLAFGRRMLCLPVHA
ncbi:hypothetical protein [Methylocella tundrae]|uniref:hypothetical protein n=1 Tax=Methylocella tundrae TaxID=227605 RepID=UPI00106C1D88|nr:hypothetical protein [Methylocella tundrae]WPP03253.1 hypothetical protein SIN04_12230 [Methylocella tundrae]